MKSAILGILFLPPLISAQPLKQHLEARAAESAKKLDPAIRAEFAKGIEAVAATDILEKAVKVGDRAPDFALKSAKGETLKLSELLKKGPVVLTWYRGGWCPYCNIALNALQQELPAIEKADATLVALTPELPDKSLSTAEKNKLKFEVLTDRDHKVAKEYGIAFELTPKVRELYKQFFDLTEFNGVAAGDSTLPLAASYVIGADGVVKWAFLEPDYRQRAEPTDIVKALQKLEN